MYYNTTMYVPTHSILNVSNQSKPTCAFRQSRGEQTSEVSGLEGGEYEVKNLKSFSIYEISLSAQDKQLGRSDSVKLIQITGRHASYSKVQTECCQVSLR